MASLKFYSNEKVVPLPFGRGGKSTMKYALTNYGRVISFLESPKEGRFLKHGLIRGYPSMAFRKGTSTQTFLLHHLVAEYFMRKPSSKHKFILHLNHKKEDNYVNNLKWATEEEKNRHSAIKRKESEKGNYKLTADRVRLIKKKMLDGKTRLKIIAKQFGVSDMQIHRIKTGENWGYVKV